jgi:arylsulfatase A-like enzyme
MGFTDLGAFGGEIPTPNLDALAERGLRLTNLHKGQACRATRLMLMSGASVSAAHEPNPDAFRGGQLGLDYATLPELLQDAGYATYIAGKWDVGELPGYTPTERGFDRSFSLLTGSAAHFAEPVRGSFNFEEDGSALQLDDVPRDFYTTDTFTDKMLGYLRSS